jgi:hypothetical protein
MKNRTVEFCFGFIVLLFGAATARGAQHAPTFPEADEALAAVLAEIATEEARFTEPRQTQDKDWVKRRLKHLFDVDQKARSAYIRPRPAEWGPEARQYFQRKLANRIIALDRANTAELKELLRQYRWFTISEFGKDVEGYAWLLVQHSDRDAAFQQEVLGILSDLLPKGETDPGHYANLWDRVARNTGKLQRYGTQGRCVAPGQWEPYEVEDPAGLNERRATLGLPTMEEYLRRSVERRFCP